MYKFCQLGVSARKKKARKKLSVNKCICKTTQSQLREKVNKI